MMQRKPETRVCPLMGGPPHITCVATKCMMYEEAPNSPAAYCLLRGIGSLGHMDSELKNLSLSLDSLQRTVEQIESTLRK
jgi:hypothetical protein